MIGREGRSCQWCHYPLKEDDNGICGTCREWVARTSGSRGAMQYAGREQQKERHKYFEERKR